MKSNSRFRESASSLDQLSPLTPRMGDSAAPNRQRSQESTLGSTAASQVHEDDDHTQLHKIFGIRGAVSSLQQGRTPVVRDSSLGTSGSVRASVQDKDSPTSHLTEENLADAALNDEEANVFGPLTYLLYMMSELGQG
jgi:hypothetical protein